MWEDLFYDLPWALESVEVNDSQACFPDATDFFRKYRANQIATHVWIEVLLHAMLLCASIQISILSAIGQTH